MFRNFKQFNYGRFLYTEMFSLLITSQGKIPVCTGLLWLIRRPSLSWQFVEGRKLIPVLHIKINNSHLQTPCDFRLLNLAKMIFPLRSWVTDVLRQAMWRSYGSPWQQHKLHFFYFFFFAPHCISCSSYIERSILSWQKTDSFFMLMHICNFHRHFLFYIKSSNKCSVLSKAVILWLFVLTNATTQAAKSRTL